MQTYRIYSIGKTAYEAYQNAITTAMPEDTSGIRTSSGFALVEPPIRNVSKWIDWVFAGLGIIHARKTRDRAFASNCQSNAAKRAKLGVRQRQKLVPNAYRELAVAAASKMESKGKALASQIVGIQADRIRIEYGWQGIHGKTFVFYGKA